MTTNQARLRAVGILGKRAVVRDSKFPSSPEARSEARDRMVALKAEREALMAERDRRLKELPWLQEMNAQIAALGKEKERQPIAHYRYAVGLDRGFFFVVEGQGDTWDQALAEAESKHKRTT